MKNIFNNQEDNEQYNSFGSETADEALLEEAIGKDKIFISDTFIDKDWLWYVYFPLLLRMQSKKVNKHIDIYLDSSGGCLDRAFAIIDLINQQKKHKINTHTITKAWSASCLIALCGQKRYIYSSATMMLHPISFVSDTGLLVSGKNVKNISKYMKMGERVVRDILKEKTKLGSKMIKKCLNSEVYFDAKMCLKYGLVDEIII